MEFRKKKERKRDWMEDREHSSFRSFINGMNVQKKSKVWIVDFYFTIILTNLQFEN